MNEKKAALKQVAEMKSDAESSIKSHGSKDAEIQQLKAKLDQTEIKLNQTETKLNQTRAATKAPRKETATKEVNFSSPAS